MITLLILATIPWSQVEITAVVINATAAGIGKREKNDLKGKDLITNEPECHCFIQLLKTYLKL